MFCESKEVLVKVLKPLCFRDFFGEYLVVVGVCVGV